MNILTGIRNVLEFIDNNWTAIIIIIGLATAIVKKVREFLSKSEDERIEIAKKQIEEIMLKLTTDAENDYKTWVDAGAIKRSQVINQIFEMYPILSRVANQEELIFWIDCVIDEALEIMRDVFSKQVDDNNEVLDETEDMSDGE